VNKFYPKFITVILSFRAPELQLSEAVSWAKRINSGEQRILFLIYIIANSGEQLISKIC